MPKILKNSITLIPSCKTLKVFKYVNSNKYYSCFYVGLHSSLNGNKIESLKTENIKEALKKAKNIYHSWFEQSHDSSEKVNFIKNIANPYFAYRIRKYQT